MNRKKIGTVALAAAILASSGSFAGSVLTAAPAQAAIASAPVSAPHVAAIPVGVSSIVGVESASLSPEILEKFVWSVPANVVGTITGYTITLKTVGKPDLTYTTKATNIEIGYKGELAEGTSYVFQVKANIVSKTGVKSTSPTANISFTTFYSWTTAKVSAPTSVSVSGVTTNSLKASWKAPVTVAGTVNYTVKLRKGTTVVKTVSVGNELSYNFTSLTSNTAYTVEVTANVVSYFGGNKASTSASKVAAVTVKAK